MSKLRQRTRHMLYAGLAGAAVMGILFAGYAIFSSVQHHAKENRIRQEYREQIARLEQARLDEEKKMATSWVLSRDILAGEVITRKDLVQVKLPQGAAPVNLIEGPEGIEIKIAKIELKKGTAITQAMIYDKEPLLADLRNREIKAVALPSDLLERDVVDVRIQFPTGQDYIILSKKKIDKLMTPAMWITMTEQEILALSSAMVDAYLHDAKLYAVTYVEPEMQDKALPTYPVNKEVLKLINSDPNIIKKAEQKLSEAIRASLEKDLEKASANGKSNENFTGSEFAPSYSNVAASSLSSQSTGGSDSTGFTFEDLTPAAGTEGGGNAPTDPAENSNPAFTNKNQDTLSSGVVQDNKLLEQSLQEKQAEQAESTTQP
ncbi:flagellar biosynthesis protein FlgA [Paenibacillus sp. HJL G12]|uniref:Flagellar biosynthesis protein FlgA n=1 Tax=Paenibacillus dendrobii TaxID=2691084 RepID=A0A7X3IE77_9BACL|nr:SAF domain-containing protein [Paenibacillus dendrobii]MWV42273.1 flagellar biosynthesis protein FlgA [Paenibacillus dendrobii]